MRTACAGILEGLAAAGEPHNTNAPDATIHITSFERALIRQEILDAYLAKQSNVPRSRQVAVVTAGPPGAGKSTVLDGRYGDDWRVIDADRVKDLLLERALADGTFDHLMSRVLPDGKPVAPRELATLVHHESAQIADRARAICLDRGESLVIEGTLSWSDMPAVLTTDLVGNSYNAVTILDIEPDVDSAANNALERWWAGRISTDPLGGRFAPESLIRGMYPAGAVVSVCASNADALRARLAAEGVPVTLMRQSGPGPLTAVAV
jgi:hypothetical protein